MSEYVGKIAVKVKSKDVWDRLDDIDFEHYGLGKDTIDKTSDFWCVDDEWGIESKIRWLVADITERIKKDGVVIAVCTDLDCDPYSETYIGINGNTYDRLYECESGNPAIASRCEMFDLDITNISEWINSGLITLNQSEVDTLKSLNIDYNKKIRKK